MALGCGGAVVVVGRMSGGGWGPAGGVRLCPIGGGGRVFVSVGGVGGVLVVGLCLALACLPLPVVTLACGEEGRPFGSAWSEGSWCPLEVALGGPG